MKAFVIAHLKNGSVKYLHSRNNSNFTSCKRWAWSTSPAIAEKTVSRLHRVQEDLGRWQEVLFFDVIYRKEPNQK